MEFITDMHVHTCGISTCAAARPEEMVEQFIAAGITTVVLTNHITCRSLAELGLEEVDGDGTGASVCADSANGDGTGTEKGWSAFCDKFLEEYRRAVDAAGDRLNVLLGAEIRIKNTKNDYLVYGVTEDVLRSWEGICLEKIKQVAPKIRESGCMIYQAHPFRNRQSVTDPTLLDGIEVGNFNYKIDSRNDIATAWAAHLNMKGVVGSDFHRYQANIGGGIVTDEPIRDNETLLSVLREGRYRIKPYQEKESV